MDFDPYGETIGGPGASGGLPFGTTSDGSPDFVADAGESVPGADPETPLTVSQINGAVKGVLGEVFPNVWLAGEVAEWNEARSGHIYFSLQDDRASIRAVIWRGAAAKIRSSLGGEMIRQGDQVIVQGGIDVYAARGTYQITVRKVQPQGLGSLRQQFERLQARLNAEGLFDADRKRTPPRLPRRIAVVTSPGGAAVHDFLRTARSRWPGVSVMIVPASVQGEGAAESIVAALRMTVEVRPVVDVVVVTRGGGSMEDLWCFNHEIVVRQIASMTIPVISGVGHEIDVTLTDLVADVRALTPTDAAVRVLPDAAAVAGEVRELDRRLQVSMRSRLEQHRKQLASLAERPVLARPHGRIRDAVRQLDDLESDAHRPMRRRLEQARSKLETASASLAALSPLATIRRGFAAALDADGRPIASIDQTAPGREIAVQVADGFIDATVRSTRRSDDAD